MAKIKINRNGSVETTDLAPVAGEGTCFFCSMPGAPLFVETDLLNEEERTCLRRILVANEHNLFAQAGNLLFDANIRIKSASQTSREAEISSLF